MNIAISRNTGLHNSESSKSRIINMNLRQATKSISFRCRDFVVRSMEEILEWNINSYFSINTKISNTAKAELAVYCNKSNAFKYKFIFILCQHWIQ